MAISVTLLLTTYNTPIRAQCYIKIKHFATMEEEVKNPDTVHSCNSDTLNCRNSSISEQFNEGTICFII